MTIPTVLSTSPIATIRRYVRAARGAIESGQVVDKDVHGTLTKVIEMLDALPAALAAAPAVGGEPVEWHWRTLDDEGKPTSKWFVVDGSIEDFKKDMEADPCEIRPLFASPAGFVSVEILNIERAVSDDLRERNAKLRGAQPASPLRGRDSVQQALEPFAEIGLDVLKNHEGWANDVFAAQWAGYRLTYLDFKRAAAIAHSLASVTGASDIVDEAACLIWAELCPGMVMGDDDRPHYENAAKAVLALSSTERGNYEDRHPNDMVLHPLTEIREWDEALAELGIQDSTQTPAEAVRELNAEIERLRAALPSTDGCPK